MGLATKELIKTHRVVEKLLEGFSVRHPRFQEIRKTLRRAVVAHAWLQDKIFLPVVKTKPCMAKCFLEEIAQEHKDLDRMFKWLMEIPPQREAEIKACVLQLRAILEAHIWKEASALYTMAEKCVDEKTLYRLGAEMDQRKNEVRDLVKE